jgi:hypothetical protein
VRTNEIPGEDEPLASREIPDPLARVAFEAIRAGSLRCTQHLDRQNELCGFTPRAVTVARRGRPGPRTRRLKGVQDS